MSIIPYKNHNSSREFILFSSKVELLDYASWKRDEVSVEMMTLFETLKTVVEFPKQLEDFLEGELPRILIAIGDSNYKAAIRALQDMKNSDHPMTEVEAAIVCLRLAYEHYVQHTTDSIIRYGLVNIGIGPDEHKKACEAAALIAVCYRYLGNASQHRQWATLCKQHFESYAKQKYDYEYGRRFLPVYWGTAALAGTIYNLFSPIEKIKEKIDKEGIEVFAYAEKLLGS